MWLDWLVFCDCGFQSVCPLMEKDERFMEASWWKELTEGKLGLVLLGGAMLCKSSIQCSVNGWGCVPSLLFNLGPNYGQCHEDNGDLLQKIPCNYCYTQHPQLCSSSPLSHTSTGDSWTLTHKSGSECTWLKILPVTLLITVSYFIFYVACLRRLFFILANVWLSLW